MKTDRQELVYWVGNPDDCEVCGRKLQSFFVDGRLSTGTWGILCTSCHIAHGVGFGEGCGQKYRKQSDGRWLKIKG